MEHDEILDMEGVPDSLESIFEDNHADITGRWESVTDHDSHAA